MESSVSSGLIDGVTPGGVEQALEKTHHGAAPD